MAIWFTFFLPAFFGGLCLGAAVMAIIAKSAVRTYVASRQPARKAVSSPAPKAPEQRKPHLTLLENCA